MVKKRGVKVPESFSNKPDIDPESSWYLNTFFKLCSSRQIGMSLGPIPVSEITDYWNNYDTLDDNEDFLDIIQAMDNTHLAYMNTKKK